MSNYYSTAEIGKMFNVKTATVQKWCREGRLKAIRLGGVYRVSEADLQKFKEQGSINYLYEEHEFEDYLSLLTAERKRLGRDLTDEEKKKIGREMTEGN